jgi:NADPH-dependent 2,4-dienoyl-CoA reductase/sulfur reductase-like enzyme
MLGHHVIHCTVNPTLYKYECAPVVPAETVKNVAVVGGGPAGCEAALTAAKRGHKVTLFEKRGIGGAMIEASAPEHKANIRRLIEFYKRQIEKQENITLKHEAADFETLKTGFDAVIIAIGGKARKLNVNGIECEQVVSAMDYLGGKMQVSGNKVAVIGGGITGAETALELHEAGKEVTVVEMADAFLANPASSCQAYSIKIAEAGIRVLTGKRLEAVNDHSITLIDRWGNTSEIEADAVVTAAGFTAQHSLADQLDEADIEVYNVGDSKRVRQIYDAVHEGFIAGRLV